MAARRMAAIETERPARGPAGGMAAAQAGPVYSQERHETPSSKAALQASPAFKGIFSFAKG
ncbi:MAG: hypothetical protein JWO67_6152 [Streptosporangiaceae bacterium]|nr:hypothetical protein [Streptosporangiaceae bacterium]